MERIEKIRCSDGKEFNVDEEAEARIHENELKYGDWIRKYLAGHITSTRKRAEYYRWVFGFVLHVNGNVQDELPPLNPPDNDVEFKPRETMEWLRDLSETVQRIRVQYFGDERPKERDKGGEQSNKELVWQAILDAEAACLQAADTIEAEYLTDPE